MKLLFSAATVVALSLATSAFAGNDWRSNDYAQINIGSGVAGSSRATVSGFGSASANLNPGFLGSGLVGHAFGNGVSVEGEFLYDENDIKGGAHVEAFGGLANVKFEAPTHYHMMGTTVSPYVAGGVGYGQSRYTVSGSSGSLSGDGVMWQAKVGLAIHQSDKMTWDVGYRYLQLPQFSQSGLKIDTYVHGITVGLRWGF